MFKEFDLKKLKETDIQELGKRVTTRITNIKDERKLDYCFYESEWENEDWYVTIGMNDFDDLIDTNDFEDWGEFDETEFDEFVNGLIKETKHYLIVAYNYTWNNRSGLKFANSLIECFIRDYDCCQYVMGGSQGKKVLSLNESHHDKPMGAETIIVALTDKEYDTLKDKSYESIMQFANDMRKKIIYI